MSRAWGGRTSGKYLTEHCALLKNLKPGDRVLADRAFTTQERLVFYQTQLAVFFVSSITTPQVARA